MVVVAYVEKVVRIAWATDFCVEVDGWGIDRS